MSPINKNLIGDIRFVIGDIPRSGVSPLNYLQIQDQLDKLLYPFPCVPFKPTFKSKLTPLTTQSFLFKSLINLIKLLTFFFRGHTFSRYTRSRMSPLYIHAIGDIRGVTIGNGTCVPSTPTPSGTFLAEVCPLKTTFKFKSTILTTWSFFLFHHQSTQFNYLHVTQGTHVSFASLIPRMSPIET